MDINKILDTIMTFINEHTDILIGVCVFLILVLIGYLIDNSVKSKRVRKDIKNKDQVPENIKKDIIEEAIDNKEVSALSKENLNKTDEDKKVESEDLVSESKEEVEEKSVEEPENTNNEFENFIIDNANPLNLNDEQSEPLNLELNNNMDISLDLPNLDVENTIQNDNLSNYDEVQGEYNNDLTLSEILFNKDQDNDNSPLNIDIVSSNIEDDTLKKENNQIDDELDAIMKKLNNTNTLENEENDDYTNIF